MNISTEEHDNTLDETNDDPSTDGYCKNIIPIVIHATTDDFMARKLREELEIERLNGEHAKMDKKIAAALEKLKNCEEESAELDYEIHIATQKEQQSKVRFENTGEFIGILKDEVEKLQMQSKEIKAWCLKITKKVLDLAEQHTKNEEYNKKIEQLEKQIQEHLDAPEPHQVKEIEELLKENEALKKVLQQKKENFEIKRRKKDKIAEMKEQKLNLLVKINQRQEENSLRKKDIEWKKDDLKRINDEMEIKRQGMEEKIKNEEAIKDELMLALQESMKNCEEKQLKIEEHKRRISQKGRELENLKKECAVRLLIREENEGKQKEFETEKENLLKLEEKLQALLEENDQKLKILNEKTEDLTGLKAKKEELMVRLCDLKIKVITRQCDNKERQKQNDALAEKLRSEQERVERLKTKNEQLENALREAEAKLNDYPKELEEKRVKIELKHKEEIGALLKLQTVRKAEMDVMQDRLNSNLKKKENLEKEIKDMEEGIDLNEMKLERRKTTLHVVQARAKKEQEKYEKLLEKSKRRETEQRKSSEIQFMEAEDSEKLSSTGRKSPGILKSPFKEPKRPQTPTKRVTFKGVSSTESSSASVEADKERVEEQTLEEFLKEWGNVALTKGDKKKCPMDF